VKIKTCQEGLNDKEIMFMQNNNKKYFAIKLNNERMKEMKYVVVLLKHGKNIL
jgi:hypothetical protein